MIDRIQPVQHGQQQLAKDAVREPALELVAACPVDVETAGDRSVGDGSRHSRLAYAGRTFDQKHSAPTVDGSRQRLRGLLQLAVALEQQVRRLPIHCHARHLTGVGAPCYDPLRRRRSQYPIPSTTSDVVVGRVGEMSVVHVRRRELQMTARPSVLLAVIAFLVLGRLLWGPLA